VHSEPVKPVTAKPGKPDWAILPSGKEQHSAAEPEHAQGGGAQPGWEVVGPVPPAFETKGKRRGKKNALEDELNVKPSAMHTALSYLGLVAALIVVLLGVLLMVGSSR
jgi:hypothetical protein